MFQAQNHQGFFPFWNLHPNEGKQNLPPTKREQINEPGNFIELLVP